MKATTLAIYGALTLLCGLSLSAQKLYQTEVVAKLTRYEIQADARQQFLQMLSNYVTKALNNENNIMAEAYYELADQSVLWIIERWTSRKEMEKLETATITLNEWTLAKSPRTYELRDLEPLTKQQWRRTANKEDQQLTVMLFVDAKKGTEENFKKIYHKAMPQFRSEPGVITYQLSEIRGDQTQFVTYEKFRSEDAFQYHLKFPPILPVLNYLNTSIKKPPFQDGIRNLVEFAPLTRE